MTTPDGQVLFTPEEIRLLADPAQVGPPEDKISEPILLPRFVWSPELQRFGAEFDGE